MTSDIKKQDTKTYSKGLYIDIFKTISRDFEEDFYDNNYENLSKELQAEIYGLNHVLSVIKKLNLKLYGLYNEEDELF